MYLFLSCLSPASRFFLPRAIIFKVGFLGLLWAALFYLIHSVGLRKNVFLSSILSGLFFSFGITIFLSHYPVRAGSEIDIILASIAFSFLFFCYQGVDIKRKMQLLGGTLLLLLHLTLCFTVAQNRPISGNLLRDALCFYCFNPTTPCKFIACPSVRCPFDYTNYSGLLAAMAWPFFIGLIQVTKNIIAKWLYILGVGYSFAVVFVSNSRAAFDLSLLFVFVYPLGWFLLKQKRFFITHKKLVGISLLLIAFLIGVLFYCVIRKESRLGLAKTGIQLIQKRPCFGYGITTIPLHFLDVHPEGYMHHCWQIHMAPVQYVFEFGCIGTLFYLLLIGYILCCALRILWKDDIAVSTKKMIYGCSLSFLLYLAFFSESSWDIFPIACFVWLLIGYVLVEAINSEPKKGITSAAAFKVICLFLGMTCTYYSARDVLGRVHFEKFFGETICSEDLHGFKHLRKALQWDPHNLHYLNQAGFYFVKHGYCRDKRIAWEGIRFYERSLRINPNQPEFLESLGALQIYMGNIQAGVRCFCQAIECTPGYTAAYLQLLDVLQHFHYQELYEQWLSCGLFLNFNLFVAQPELLAYFQTHTSVQQQFLNHFEELKQRYPKDYDGLSFEYGLRKILLHRTPLQLTEQQKKFFSRGNYLRVLSWEHLSKNVIAKPFRRLYRLNLHQHSNPNVLLHGRQAQFIRMATLKGIYPTSGSSFSAKKHAHTLLRPLIQATVKQFSESFKK